MDSSPLSQPEVLIKNTATLKNKSFWVIFFLIICSSAISFFLGGFLAPKKTSKSVANPFVTPTKVFSTQAATIRGQIIKVSPSSITIQNNLGKASEFPLSSKVFITKYNSEGKQYLSQNISQLELKKDAIINLELPQELIGQKVDQAEYKIIAITYIPPLPKNIIKSEKSLAPSASN